MMLMRDTSIQFIYDYFLILISNKQTNRERESIGKKRDAMTDRLRRRRRRQNNDQRHTTSKTTDDDDDYDD